MADIYRAAYISEIQSALAGTPTVDLYVRIEQADRYLIFLRRDQKLSTSKLENLQRLAANSFYVREDSEAPKDNSGAAGKQDPVAFLDTQSSFRNEVLGVEASQLLNQSYKSLVDASDDKGPIAQKLIAMSETMLDALAPESEDLKKSLVKNLANLEVMNHAAAISTLTFLVALSNEFTSRTALRQISQACILMDISLSELEPHHLNLYYSDRKLLPSHAQEIVKHHCVRSHQLLTKYPEVSDSIGQLILLHHELHNGKGYHRGIRTLNVLPLARVLALGVDLYEQIKSAELNKTGRKLRQIVLDLRESKVEPHNRRHTSTLIENLIKYLKIS